MSQDGEANVPENTFGLGEVLSLVTGAALVERAANLFPILTYMTGEREPLGTFWMQEYWRICGEDLRQQFPEFRQAWFLQQCKCLRNNLDMIEESDFWTLVRMTGCREELVREYADRGPEAARKLARSKFSELWLKEMRGKLPSRFQVLTLQEHADTLVKEPL
jgi:hypothetical protein